MSACIGGLPCLEKIVALEPLIAVVDDDAPFRDAMSGLMRVSGFRVQTYASGTELLEGARLSEISLFLLDVQMPEMSGIELLRLLRARGCEKPVIFVTGTRDAKAQVAVLEDDTAVVAKPFDPDELIALVQGAVPAAPH